MDTNLPVLSEAQSRTFRRDGCVCLRGVFNDWVDIIASGVDSNMRSPGPHASENISVEDRGRFFDDYCNWQRIPEFEHVVLHSPAARIAAACMESNSAQFFHDHVLVKEPGTTKPTPWHQDIPYYFVDGRQTVSFWIPIDPVREATLRLIAGSHRWKKMVLPVRWLSDDNFYPESDQYLPVPDPDSDPEVYEIREWEMEPGDAVLFDFRTVHGARANMSASRRRAFSMRWIGDDVRYASRPGPTSPPFTDHGMSDGQRLREDWFPVVWRAGAACVDTHAPLRC